MAATLATHLRQNGVKATIRRSKGLTGDDELEAEDARDNTTLEVVRPIKSVGEYESGW